MKKREAQREEKRVAQNLAVALDIWDLRKENDAYADKFERMVGHELPEADLDEVQAHLNTMYAVWFKEHEANLRRDEEGFVAKEIANVRAWYALPHRGALSPGAGQVGRPDGSCLVCGSVTIGLYSHEYHDISAVLAGLKPATWVSTFMGGICLPEAAILCEEATRRGLFVATRNDGTQIVGRPAYAKRALAAVNSPQRDREFHARLGLALGYPKAAVREFLERWSEW